MLRETKEVIGGALVTRFNGNNPKGSRATGGPRVSFSGIRKAPAWVQAKASTLAARRRVSEQAYAREYLGGS